jgi:hypothetical protein
MLGVQHWRSRGRDPAQIAIDGTKTTKPDSEGYLLLYCSGEHVPRHQYVKLVDVQWLTAWVHLGTK